MKKLALLALVIGTMASCNQKDNSESNTNTSEKTEIMEKKDKESIEKLLSEYKSSLNTSNAELSRSLYTKDGVFMPSEGPSAHGSDEILKSYEFVYSQIQLNIEFYIEEIVVQGDFAFATTTSKGSVLIHATGDTAPEENRELFVFEKIDGEWKIARYMFNKMNPKG